MAELAAVGDRVKEMKRVGSGRIGRGRRQRKRNKTSWQQQNRQWGETDNMMDRFCSGRIGSDRRHRSSEIMLAWQGGGQRVRRILYQPGVVLTDEMAGLHQELHQLRLESAKKYWH